MLPGGSSARSSQGPAFAEEAGHFFFREAAGLVDLGREAVVFEADFFFAPDFFEGLEGLAGSPPVFGFWSAFR